MSQSTDPRSGDGCELPPVTCWPLILGAGAFVALGAAVAACLFVGDWLRPLLARPEPAAVAQEINSPAAHIDRGPDSPAAREGDRAVVVSHLVREREGMPGRQREPEAAPVVRPTDLREPASAKEPAALLSLWAVSREVDLERVAGAGEELARDRGSLPGAAMEQLLQARDDLRGLPLLVP